MFKKLIFLAWILFATISATSQGHSGSGDSSTPNSSNSKTAFGSSQVSSLHPQVSIRFNYGLHTRLYEDHSANSGTFTVANGLATVATGTNSSGKGAMHSKDVLSYTPGQGARVRYTAAFTTCVANSTQYAGITDGVDGFVFGCDGATFGLSIVKDSSFTWHPQSTWNVDKMDGAGPSGMDIVETNLNVYQIQYQWLGAGQINYFIENDATGVLVLVHSIKYTNRFTVPSISNPTLPMSLHAENSGNTTSLTINSSSMAAFNEGTPGNGGIINSTDLGELAYLSASNEDPIITIRNRATYFSKTNRIQIKLLSIGMSSDGTKNVTFRAYLNAALTGASFSDINTNESVVEVDTSTSSITGGSKIFSEQLAKADAENINIANFDIIMHPGDSITITADSSSNSTVSIDYVWREQF